MATVLFTLWKYRRLALMALGVAVIAATHAWAYSAGENAEANRIMRDRLAAFEASYTASLAEIAALNSQLSEIATDTETATREIVRYVPDDRACDLGLDAIRVLNTARGHTMPAPR